MHNDAAGQPAIARHIYQCVARKDRLRDAYIANIEHLRTLNPLYTHELFDDADILDFVADAFGGRFVDALNAINDDYGAARADFFRYLIVHRRGGVYLDIKSGADLPLDTVLTPDDRYILSQWHNADPAHPFYRWGMYLDLRNMPRGEYQQWHVIAAAGHPYLEAVIELMMKRIEGYAPWRVGVGHRGVIRTTGPIMYSQAIEPIRTLHPHRLIRDETVIGLRYSVLVGEHDHRQLSGHYVESYQPVLRMHGGQAMAGEAYSIARRGVDRFVRTPLRRMLRPLRGR